MKFYFKQALLIVIVGAAAMVGVRAIEWVIPKPPIVVLLCTPEEVKNFDDCIASGD